MFFTVLGRNNRLPDNASSRFFLIWDDWNDYNFYTLFGAVYVDAEGSRKDLGGVVIGFMGQREKQRALNIDQTFDQIPDSHFSVGSDDQYYMLLNGL